MPVPCAPSLPPPGNRPRTAQHLQLAIAKPGSASFSLTPRSLFTPQSTLRPQSQRSHDQDKPIAVFAKGARVVDVCSHRQALVLAVSRTHCKVRYEVPSGEWSKDEEPAPEVIPTDRLRPLSDGGLCSAASFGLTNQDPLYCLSRWTESAERAGGSHRLKQMQLAPLSLLTCVAAPQALQKRKPRSVVEVCRRVVCRSRSPTNRAEQSEEEVMLERFRAVAAARYGGSVGAAWRIAIDVRGVRKVGFQEFARGGRTIGFVGNYKKLWAALTGGCKPEDGLVSMEQVDPAGWDVLEAFRCQFSDLGMTLEDIWEQQLDVDGSGRCLRVEFLEVLARWGWDKPRADILFRMLDIGGQSDLSLDELEDVGFQRRAKSAGPSRKEVARECEEEAKVRAYNDFKGYLLRGFGNLVRGWRAGLDVDGDGKLRFREFCACCKNIGWREKLMTLWKSLDSSNKGYITLQDLHPEAFTALQQFRELLEEDYRSLDDVWERIFDPDRSGRCSLQEFTEGCHMLKYRGNAGSLFRWLDLHHRRDLGIEDMQFIGMRRRVVTSVTARQKILERQVKDQEQAESMYRKFKTFLMHQYGSVVHAWRIGLDPDGDGKMQFTEFCARCRQIRFQGNLKALWLALDNSDQGYVSLEDLDPVAVAGFEDFRQLASIFFDDLDSLWLCCLDPDGSGKCSLDEFRQGCRRLRYHRNVGQLFKHLDIRFDGAITADQLEFFKLPRAASREAAVRQKNESGFKSHAALRDFLEIEFGGSVARGWRKGFCQGPHGEHLTEILDAETFFGRCRAMNFRTNFLSLWIELTADNSGSRPSTRGSPSKNTCEDVAKDQFGGDQVRSPRSPAPERRSPVELEKLKARSPTGLSQVEFLGFVGLGLLEPNIYQELQSFRKLCRAKLGSTEETWRAILKHCLESNYNAKIREVQFAHGARQIGFEGDAIALFAACDLESDHQIGLDEIRFLQIDESLPFDGVACAMSAVAMHSVRTGSRSSP